MRSNETIISIGRYKLFSITWPARITELVCNILLFLYWIVVIINFVYGMNNSIYFYARLLISCFSMVVTLIEQSYNHEKNMVLNRGIIIVLVMLFFGILSSLINGNYSPSDYLYASLASCGIAYILACVRIYKWVPNTLFIIFVLLFMQYYAANNGNMWYFLAAGGNSRNYISVMLFAISIMIYNAYLDGSMSRIWRGMVIGIDVVLSVLADGRGGLITMYILAILSIYVWMKNADFSRTIIRAFCVSSLILAAVVYAISAGYIDVLIGDFSIHGMDSSRFSVIMPEYFKLLKNPIYLFFGGPYRSSPVFSSVEHLHNSYLMLHARYGLLVLLMVVVSLLKGIKSLWNDSIYGRYFSVLILAFLIRCYTDSILGFTYCDTIMIFLMCLSCRIEYGKKYI